MNTRERDGVRTTLAGRVVRMTTAAIVVIVPIFGYVGYRITGGTAKTEIIQRQQNAAAAAMATVQRLLADAMQDVQLIAEDSGVERRLEIAPAANDSELTLEQRQFDQMVRLTGPWDEVIVLDRAGTIVISNGSIPASD